MATDLKISQLTAGDPAESGDLIPVDRSGSNFKVTAGSIADLAPAQTAPSAVIFSLPNWATPNSTQLESIANFFSLTTAAIGGGSTVSIIPSTATQPAYSKFVNATGTSGFAVMWKGQALQIRLDTMKNFKQKVWCFAKTNLRYWIGFSTSTDPQSGYWQDNNPPAFSGTPISMCMFRYVDGTDTHWEAYCATSHTNFTAVDTGVSVDTTGAPHTFEIAVAQGTPGTINFLIDDVQVAQITTNVPAASTLMTPLSYIEALAGTTPLALGTNLWSLELYQ
jgi:hypothetical protein